MPHRIDHTTAERQFRALLERHDLPQPDEVAYWRDALVLGWHETKAVVVIDLDEADEHLATQAPAELEGSLPTA